MEFLKVATIVCKIVFALYATYKFRTGDNSNNETLWWGILLIAVLV